MNTLPPLHRAFCLVALLMSSSAAMAFNDTACNQGRVGEQNPHCLQPDAVNSVPEPGTLLLIASAASGLLVSRLRIRPPGR